MDEEKNTPTPETHTVTSNGPAKPSWARRAGTRLTQGTRAVRTRTELGRRSLVFGVVGLVLAAAAGFGGGLLAHGGDSIVAGSLSEQKKIVSNEGELISQISKSVGPSVVSINTSTTATTTDFFGQPQQQESAAAGTGIVLTKDGVIMTNRHVVPAGTTDVSVTLADGTTFDNVKVLGRTSSNDSLDVAFLKIQNLKGKTLNPATIGDSSTAQVGDSVVAIGNALGQFQNTVTSGIISGFGRNVQASSGGGGSSPFGGSTTGSSEDLDNLIQTDAAINEGNSGGPLVNLNGQVIGINTAIASDAQNIGFAIPINDVKGLINQILKTGKFQRPYLGVRYVVLTSQIAKQYGASETSGAYIVPESVSGQPGVVAGSPADKAGLQPGDVIKKVNDDTISTTHGLTSLLNHYQPGDKVNLTVVRGGKTMHISVNLGTADNRQS